MNKIGLRILAWFCLGMIMSSHQVLSQESVKIGSYPVQPVPFTSVKVTDNFWAPKIKINHKVTIPIAIDQSTTSGRIKNFDIAAGIEEGKFCSEYPFDDTDIYKIIEAASYSLQTFPDSKLEAYLDSLIAKVAGAQEKDGYLYTIRTIEGDDSHDWIGKRWEKVHLLSHELYNSGHMFEAAAAHFQATGKRNFLDIAIKNADLIDNTFGWGKLENFPGHQEVEVGLIKLYNVTGEKKYLDLAKFFLDVRGPNGEEYSQSHKKVTNQTNAVGHSVRATYMYSAMADIAALYNDESYIKASRAIWGNVVQKKLYVTGGIGASAHGEAFGKDYFLPNMSAYCETCASIGNVMWNFRMFLYDGESKYYDVLERTLYNALISGVSLKGDRFFYPNPLESMGQHERGKWFGCACCPPNVARLLPSLPGYIYAKKSDAIYVNLFMDNTALIELDETTVEIIQKTGFPWEGSVDIEVNPKQEKKFALQIRIPGWARNSVVPSDLYEFLTPVSREVQITINNKPLKFSEKSGYAVIQRKWSANDKIRIEFPMEPRIITANEKVEATKNKIAIQRGPFVYAAEWPDITSNKVLNLLFSKDQTLITEKKDTLLGGIYTLKTTAKPAKVTAKGKIQIEDPQQVSLIPYYAWNNRGPGEMMVWMPMSEKSMQPIPFPTIASRSKVTGSSDSKSIISVNDQLLPKNSIDRTWPFYHWWPKKNTNEWVQYDFDNEITISSSKVYFYDDSPFGGCRVPESWEIQYKSGEKWLPVKAISEYRVEKDSWCSVDFEPVKTNSLRLNIKLQKKFSAGVHEWEVE
jgi:DUF1680 family protein